MESVLTSNSTSAGTWFLLWKENTIVGNYTANGSATAITLPGVTFLGKQVYRLYYSSTFPSNSSPSITLVSSASNWVRYEGQVGRSGTNQTHDIKTLGVTQTNTTHPSPVFFSGGFNTVGGSIQLFNNAGNTSFDGQTYWVMIEYTTT